VLFRPFCLHLLDGPPCKVHEHHADIGSFLGTGFDVGNVALLLAPRVGTPLADGTLGRHVALVPHADEGEIGWIVRGGEELVAPRRQCIERICAGEVVAKQHHVRPTEVDVREGVEALLARRVLRTQRSAATVEQAEQQTK
jgi:hypothetical protein